MNLGLSIFSKEVQEKTADFLFTKPVTRTAIMTAKLLAAFCSLLVTNVIYIVAAVIIASAVSKEPIDLKALLLISVSALLMELMFLLLGVVVVVIARRIKTVLPLSLSIVFAFFILSMFGSIIGEKAIRYLTPFKYYDTAYIIKHSAYEPSFIMIEVIFVIAAIVSSYLIYTKNDIHSV
jgi:ABC-2 type transport system permease protein